MYIGPQSTQDRIGTMKLIALLIALSLGAAGLSAVDNGKSHGRKYSNSEAHRRNTRKAKKFKPPKAQKFKNKKPARAKYGKIAKNPKRARNREN